MSIKSTDKIIASLLLFFLCVFSHASKVLALDQTVAPEYQLPDDLNFLPLPAVTKTSPDFDPIYTYDLNRNRVSMIDPTGITTYSYDAINRLTSITNNRGFTTTFTYDALGRRTSMTHANGVMTTYEYDKGSLLTKITHQLGATIINSFSYSYDRVGNRLTKVDRSGTYTYTYDTLNRLVHAVNPLPSDPLETYTYDPVGNREDSNQNGPSTFNAGNQLTEDGTFRYTYDRNGDLIRKTHKATGEFIIYEYDAENKLVRVVTPGKAVNYRHDGLGRRVEKEIIDITTAITRYIYDNEDILLELDGQNNIVARYTHGPGIDEPLIMEKGGQFFFYHADGLGSITEITDINGNVVQRYTYSSFGKIESQLDPNFVQPYTFTAREFDPETGLYHYRKRDYDPFTGRFQQEDPFPFNPFNPQTLNRYVYVLNSPTNAQDPLGLQAAVPAGPLPIPLPIVPGPVVLTPGQARDLMKFISLFDPRPFAQFLSNLIDKIKRGEPVTPGDIEDAMKGQKNLVCEVGTPSGPGNIDPNKLPDDPRLRWRIILMQALKFISQFLR